MIAVGHLVYEALEAAAILDREACHIAVFDPCLLKPLNEEAILDEARKVSMVVTFEENVPSGSLGQAVASLLAVNGYEGRVCTISVPDDFAPQGTQRELRKILGLDSEGLVSAIRNELIKDTVVQQASNF